MSISSIGAADPTATQNPANKTQLSASSDQFLKLFVAQLQAQDPLDPQKGSDMVAQLAQLSSVEQSAQTNSELAALAAQQGSTANASMSTLVGRQIDATAGDFTVQAGGGTPPLLDLSATSSMQGASVVITDDNGKEVRRIPVPSGTNASLQWDGKDASGQPLKPGNYHMSIDQGSSTAAITATWHGSVGAVQLTPDGTRLQMGDLLINPSSVTTIGAL